MQATLRQRTVSPCGHSRTPRCFFSAIRPPPPTATGLAPAGPTTTFLDWTSRNRRPRTTDPVGPRGHEQSQRLHNLACTVCHSVLDPVAGAFQRLRRHRELYRDQLGRPRLAGRAITSAALLARLSVAGDRLRSMRRETFSTCPWTSTKHASLVIRHHRQGETGVEMAASLRSAQTCGQRNLPGTWASTNKCGIGRCRTAVVLQLDLNFCDVRRKQIQLSGSADQTDDHYQFRGVGAAPRSSVDVPTARNYGISWKITLWFDGENPGR